MNIHEKMISLLKEEDAYLDDILYCPHRTEENCPCRKPKPGMLLRASQRHNINLNESWMIGDYERDIAAGAVAGCKTILANKYRKCDSGFKPDLTIDQLFEITNLPCCKSIS